MKIAIATVKTENQTIIEGVNRLKDVYGSASAVCEKALEDFLTPKKHTFPKVETDANESLPHHVGLNFSVSDYWTLSEIANQNQMTVSDVLENVALNFIRGEIRFYKPENPVNIEETTETQIVTSTETTDLQTVNDSENIIIKVSELVNPDVIQCLRNQGFEENRYYTPQKERATNQQFDKVLTGKTEPLKAEIELLKAVYTTKTPTDTQIEGLVNGTKTVIKILINKPPIFKKHSIESILSVFPMELHEILKP